MNYTKSIFLIFAKKMKIYIINIISVNHFYKICDYITWILGIKREECNILHISVMRDYYRYSVTTWELFSAGSISFKTINDNIVLKMPGKREIYDSIIRDAPKNIIFYQILGKKICFWYDKRIFLSSDFILTSLFFYMDYYL